MYTVRTGDTLYRIAQRHGVRLDDLLRANPQIRNPNLIQLGQRLSIPGQRDEFVPSTPTPAAEVPPQYGARGAAVLEVQRQLVQAGYLSQSHFATGPGVFGPRTDAALRAFQRAHGLVPDGIAGGHTRRALADAARGEAPQRPLSPRAPTLDQGGLYDGTRPAAGTNPGNPATPIDAPVQNRPGERSAGAYAQVINQFAVGVNPRYKPRNGDTYCNIFAWDVTRAMGAEIPHWVGGRELNVNATHNWLRTQGAANGWRRASAEEAQDLANRGSPAIALWPNPGGIGHVAVVRPGELTSAGPAIAQAGRINVNRAHVADTFEGRVPQYWVHD